MTTPSNAEPAPAKQPLVLVVEDSEDIREAMDCLLSGQGYRVATAKDGFDGMRKAATLHPDIILMDINMPGMDGVETTRYLKRFGATSGIPVVAVTGQVMLDDAERARRRGFEAVLMKPIDTQALTTQIEQLLHRL